MYTQCKISTGVSSVSKGERNRKYEVLVRSLVQHNNGSQNQDFFDCESSPNWLYYFDSIWV